MDSEASRSGRWHENRTTESESSAVIACDWQLTEKREAQEEGKCSRCGGYQEGNTDEVRRLVD